MSVSQSEVTVVGEPSLVAILEAYKQATQKGEKPNREELLRQHPQLAAELKKFWSEDDRATQSIVQLSQPPLLQQSRPSVLLSSDEGMTIQHISDPGEAAAVAETQPPPAPRSTAEILQRVGEYELLDEIARGGMGVVYKARHISLQRVVALKMILAGQFASDFDLQRFQTEAEAAANLDHPNIVPIYEVDEYQDRHFFTMKLIEGGNLAQRTAEAHKPRAFDRAGVWAKEERTVARLLAKVARAIHYAHMHGVLHRDLKPANILLDLQGEPHVTDFGLAKRFEKDTKGLTQSGTLVGTPSYMSPEQAMNSGSLTTAADVYSLGAILFETLTGRPPFRAETPLETLMEVIEKEPPRPSAFNHRISRDLETICLKCLEKKPNLRYPSAEALADELDRWLRREPIQARPVGTLGRLLRWCQRNPTMAGLTASLVGLILLTLVGVGLVALNLKMQALKNQADDAREQAENETAKAIVARNDAERAQVEAERLREQALLDARRIKRDKDIRDAQLAMNRGKDLCEQGDTARGLLWLGRSFEITPADATDQQRAVWASLTGWLPRVDSLRYYVYHKNYTTVATFSPDGKTFATGSTDGQVRLWKTATGDAIWQSAAHASKDGHLEPITSLAFSPDGKWLLSSSGGWWTSRQGFTRLLEAATGNTVGGQQPFPAPVWSVAFSPDGKRFVAGCLDGKAYAAETAGQKWSPPLEHKRPVTAVAYTPNGDTLLVACTDNVHEGVREAVHLWDTATGKFKGQWLSHPGGIRAMVFSPDGKTLLTRGEDGKARLWDWASGRLRLPRPIDHLNADITCVAYSPDGRFVLTSGKDSKVRLWNATTGEPAGQPIQHPGEVAGVAPSPDGVTFVTLQANAARLWELSSTRVAQELPLLLPETVVGMVLSPDGKRLAVRTMQTRRDNPEYKVWLYDPADGKPLGKGITDAGGGERALAVHSKYDLVAFGDHNGNAWIWNGLLGTRHVPVAMHHNKAVVAAAFSPDGALLVTGSEDNTARVFDATTGVQRLVLQHESPVTAVAFHPGGMDVLTGTAGGITKLWNVVDWRDKQLLDRRKEVRFTGKAWGSARHAGQVEAVGFSPDGDTFAVAVWGDTTVRLFDTENQAPLGPPLQHPSRIWSLAFSPDSTTLITGCADGKARLWDTATSQPLGAPVVGKSGVRAVAFAFADEEKKAVAAEEGKVLRTWKVRPLESDQRERIVLWTKVLTGMELDPQGAAKVLDAKRWSEYRKQLVEKLGGPPEKLEINEGEILQWHLQEAGDCEARRQWFAARWHLNHVVQADPENPTLRDRRGRILVELGDWRAAATDFRKAVDWHFDYDRSRKPADRSPVNMDQWDRYAMAALMAQDSPGFRSFCATCLKLYVDEAQPIDRLDPVLIERLTALARYGTPAPADLEYLARLAERAVAVDPRSAWTQLTLGAIRFRQQKYKEALQSLKNARYNRGDAEDPRECFFLAMVNRRLGDAAQAQKDLAKGLQLLEQHSSGPWTTRQELLLLRKEAEALGG
jgi:WD40 repeat protein/serine/threonine protein kinase